MKDRFTIRFKNKQVLQDLKYLSFILNKSTNRVIQDFISQGIKNYKNEYIRKEIENTTQLKPGDTTN